MSIRSYTVNVDPCQRPRARAITVPGCALQLSLDLHNAFCGLPSFLRASCFFHDLCTPVRSNVPRRRGIVIVP
jgi:hypothetical protein